MRKNVRKGSVLNVTRKNAALKAVRESSNYRRAVNAGLNNAGAQNYSAKMRQWHSDMPQHSSGMHQNNAAARFRDWELTHPMPLLPGEAPDPNLVLRTHEHSHAENDRVERNMREQYGHFDGGRKSRKSRKSRR
jgi:hypothetical protein